MTSNLNCTKEWRFHFLIFIRWGSTETDVWEKYTNPGNVTPLNDAKEQYLKGLLKKSIHLNTITGSFLLTSPPTKSRRRLALMEWLTRMNFCFTFGNTWVYSSVHIWTRSPSCKGRWHIKEKNSWSKHSNRTAHHLPGWPSSVYLGVFLVRLHWPWLVARLDRQWIVLVWPENKYLLITHFLDQ